MIEAGDTVKYYIDIYNNTDREATEVSIKDRLDIDLNKVDISEENSVPFNSYSNYIEFSNLTIPASGYKRLVIKIKFKEYYTNPIGNHAEIISEDNETEYRTKDADFVKMKEYAVSIEKYISAVNGVKLSESRIGKPEHNSDNNNSTNDYSKRNSVVTVSNGDMVSYTIKVTNNSTDTSVRISEITDYLPDGVRFAGIEYNGGQYDIESKTDNKKIHNSSYLLKPKQAATLYHYTVSVIEPNISLNTLKNVAEITMLKNKNGVTVTDSTPNDNMDADYVQLDDITISGMVWNDRALDKASNKYNGKYDGSDKEKTLSGIKVYLYRDDSELATTTTDSNGNYKFKGEEGDYYIKASQNTGNNRWNSYYSGYYVVFEYDGVKYTSSKFAEVNASSNYDKDSNAYEDGPKVAEKREAFNKKFTTIKYDGAYNTSGTKSMDIEYNTYNERFYIPESNYVYNDNMKIQSSTKKIDISNDSNLEEQLQHVGLGLRGKDTFDLSLTSDVYSTKVIVNGVAGVYYDNHKVVLRRSDISYEDGDKYYWDTTDLPGGEVKQVSGEDMANVYPKVGDSDYSGFIYQQVRQSDISVNKTGSGKNGTTKYSSTGLEIEVTYKITVQNDSVTKGTATKITNYYGSEYSINSDEGKVAYYYQSEEAKNNDIKTWITSDKINNKVINTDYRELEITTPGTMLNQPETMDIYIVYTFNNPAQALLGIVNIISDIDTFNMAEITEYKTQCGSGQTEYTRGLIDKNSRPDSADKELVRLDGSEDNITTVKYYFGKENLYSLKYEDDTYVAALTFGSSSNLRKITGTVFEDETTIDSSTRIKTGNGKLDDGEVGVYGATVELVELTTNKAPEEIGKDEGIIRYRVSTDESGKFEISGFLPGNYVIRYYYGDTEKTVLLNQSGDVNKKSYNGEDFQATNNYKDIEGKNVGKLNQTTDYWYVFNENEGISTAKDNLDRRGIVSDNVTKFIDEEMTALNNIRDGISVTSTTVTFGDGSTKEVTVDNIINSTYMFATTPQMVITVEETVDLNKLSNKDELLAENKIRIIDKDKGIGQWARFPISNNTSHPYEEYNISNMNFGIAEVPVTTIDLQKHVKEFKITDSTGQNVIASMEYDGTDWTIKGEVTRPIPYADIAISIENEKLQGARLEVTYEVTTDMDTEKNFDDNTVIIPEIGGLVDFVHNSLSYNSSLGDNATYWDLTTYAEIYEEFNKQIKWDNTTEPEGTIDPTGKAYTTILKAKTGNPLLLTRVGSGSATITLERILSSTDSTIEEIITSTIDSFEYDNKVEITSLNYGTAEGVKPNRDRIRTPDRYIIIPGVQHDSAISERIVIHPPTGDSNINIVYYVLAAISLVILAAGVFGIRKFVLKK